ncbi:hypothetical protein COW36_09065 [bacterium (Candidatus Blackallbacteria) CG17_big_fil_post_rev_8_21_14_2_50_48_46]|uniref:Uncharacterized protein n=1 Tax=bacterium (Candidatus Blackallbacteria) CG17_big_fil_post_rev_8_21_14_2_50_48_46 TaxID=2014261 RepID=A0A2M7G5Q2_9BACT|nr:MAG: hypothetical protein COW64_23985 [bacterium (Candidatus Blackallbacteria) CG18_big_fil_WC_8_21_14_2_50_49_26]PIW17317.1 MAG: hypothetical protein COW36_09065 [bacterium (Candidatus Blackallbacteria) CG17_big_fil_post_rev_8_21_14_2_50_48_46]PIW47452.1 MAG: hypothetical protein COW20_12765 [bacterium (Candidatus Blackallbacteria) CG13_big_fil_rev_8_21_14_2_50_49_14]
MANFQIRYDFLEDLPTPLPDFTQELTDFISANSRFTMPPDFELIHLRQAETALGREFVENRFSFVAEFADQDTAEQEAVVLSNNIRRRFFPNSTQVAIRTTVTAV